MKVEKYFMSLILLQWFLVVGSAEKTQIKLTKKITTEEPSDVEIFCEPASTFFSLVKDYDHQIHTILSADRYLITVFRVRQLNPPKNLKPVLLIHGIVDSSDAWALGPNSAVPNLIKAGYDVWLMNTRGNKYSCKHADYSSSLPKFWDFSFQEMGKFDVPAVSKHIFEETNQKVAIIGHSQGSTQVFVAFAEFPGLNQWVDRFMAVAPVAYLTGFEIHNVYNYMATHRFLQLIEKTGIHRILEHKINGGWASDWLLKLFCTTRFSVCSFIMSKLTDKDARKLDHSQYHFYLRHNPSRTNLKSVKHFVQQIINYDGFLRKFDYGETINIEKYGQNKPPAYDVTSINVPVYMYYGDNDVLCTKNNVDRLVSEIKNNKARFYPGWGHLCYFWGVDRQMFVNDLIEDLKDQIAM